MRLRKGMVVAVEFDDHAQDSNAPIRCRVYGRIAAVARKHIVLIGWETIGQNQRTKDANDTRYSIIRSAIVHVSHLGDA